ncbi:MAG TPA: endo-1,4-beta-xylanase [Sphingobium sp.]
MPASRRAVLTAMISMPLMGAIANNSFASKAGATGAEPVRGEVRPRHGQIRFGAAIRPDQLDGEGPLLTAIRNCDIVVPEYHGQWSAVEWDRHQPWYGNYDAILAFAEQNGQMVRGHSLIWDQMTPEWAKKEMLDHRRWKTVERHFETLLPRYSGRIGEWIVVNEMIDTEDGDRGLRRTSFQRAFGNDYVANALRSAHALDPQARLMINEFGTCHDNPVDEARRVALLKLVEKLKARGVPLHQVGLQGHLELAKGALPQARLARFLSDLADTGVTIAFTEVDVLEDDRSLPLDQRDARVAHMVSDLLDVARAQPAVASVVTWGLNDRHSWLQERARETEAALNCLPMDCTRLNRGLPYDAEMKPKPLQARLARAVKDMRTAGDA